MREYYKRLERINADFAENREMYFSIIREIAEKYGGRAYLFGSQLKGNAIAASDVDVLVVIPNEVHWLDVLVELKEKVRNPKFQFHVRNVKEAEVIMWLIGQSREL